MFPKEHAVSTEEMEAVRQQTTETIVYSDGHRRVWMRVTYGGVVTYIVQGHGTEVARVHTLDEATGLFNDL